ncbi:MAG TPA: VOC family protein [Solirubrobacteraceae bacterium]|nr:VOC family protein [Solirubrobacteraceae bacterium]
MGTRTKYSPGTFSWSDLTTPDQDAAKGFYSALFGWEADDQPIGDGAFYSLMSLDGQSVAAIAPQPQQQRDAGAPPLWNSYITVESADASLGLAIELGAQVHADAFDVMEAGRMGVAQDPQGAFFLVWEPRSNIGAGLVNAPGALSWNELHAEDLDAAEDFYGQLFGWSLERFPSDEIDYRIIKTADGRSNGGMSGTVVPDAPAHWLVYFGAESADSSVAKLGELGGTTLMEPMDLGPGLRIAVVQDPQGAVFALYSGRFDD